MSSGRNVDIRYEASLAALANVAILGIEFITVILLARELGASGIGTYFFILTIAIVLNRPNAAMSEVVQKRGSEVGTDTGKYFGLAVFTMATYLVVIGVFGFVLLLTGVGPVEQITQRQFLGFTAVAGGRSIYGLSRQLYKACGKPATAMWINTIRDIVFLPAFLVAIALGGDAITVVVVRAGVLVTLAVGALLRVGVAPKMPDRRVAERSYEYVRWRMPSKFISTTLGKLPILLLGGLVGSSAVGVYQAAYRVTELGPYVGTCVKTPLHVKISAITSTGGTAAEYVKNAMSYTPIIALPVLFVVVSFPSTLLEVLYGEQFASGGVALVIIAVGELLFALSRTLKGAINGADRPKTVLKADAAAIVVGLPFGVIATIEYGVLGGAALFILTETIMYAVMQYSAYQLFGIDSFGGDALLWFVAGGILTTISIRTTLLFVDPTTILELLAVISIGLLPYIALPLLFHQSTRNGAIATLGDLRAMLSERV